MSSFQGTPQTFTRASGCCCGTGTGTGTECECDSGYWAQVFADNGSPLFIALPCANTPDPLELAWDGTKYTYTGAWGLCADDFADIRLDCESEPGSLDPLSCTPQLTGLHGGNAFRLPLTVLSTNPFFAEFTELPFDAGNSNSNEPCGGCGEPSGMTGTVSP